MTPEIAVIVEEAVAAEELKVTIPVYIVVKLSVTIDAKFPEKALRYIDGEDPLLKATVDTLRELINGSVNALDLEIGIAEKIDEISKAEEGSEIWVTLDEVALLEEMVPA